MDLIYKTDQWTQLVKNMHLQIIVWQQFDNGLEGCQFESVQGNSAQGIKWDM